MVAASAPKGEIFVTGTLTTATGEPVRAFAVSFTLHPEFDEALRRDPAAAARLAERTATDTLRGVNETAGSFRFGPIEPGRYTIGVTSGIGSEYMPQTFELAVTPELGDVKHDLVLAKLHRVRVNLRTPKGAAFGPPWATDVGLLDGGTIQVVATREPLALSTRAEGLPTSRYLGKNARVAEAEDLLRGTTRAYIGDFGFDVPEAFRAPTVLGQLFVPAQALYANFLWRAQVVASVPVAPDAKEIAFELDPKRVFASLGSVRFVAVDSAVHSPIEGARIATHVSIDSQAFSTSTGPDGSALLRGLPVGRTFIRVSATGYGVWQRWFELGVGQILDLGELALSPEIGVFPQVVDPAGVAVAHALEFVQLDTNGLEAEPLRTTTHADHVATTRGLAAQRYVVRSRRAALANAQSKGLARRDGGLAWAERETEFIDLDDGTLAVAPTVVDLGQPFAFPLVLKLAPLHVCSLQLTRVHEDVVQVCVTTPEHVPVAEVFAAGDALVECLLAPGDYRVCVSKAGTKLAESAFAFAGAAATIRVP